MVDEGMQEVDTFVDLHQNTAAQFITTRPVMDMCLAAVQIPGVQVSKW